MELCTLANELTILFPWGSLLRGVLAIDSDAARGISALVAPGGRVDAIISVTERDAVDGVPVLDERLADGLASRWACNGLSMESWRCAQPAEISASGSTWARRLGAGGPRAAWRLTLTAPPPDGHSPRR